MSSFSIPTGTGAAAGGGGGEIPHRVHNFSAGPGCLPLEVLQEVQEEMLSYHGSGMSFMEMSHRDVTGPVQKTVSAAAGLVKELLDVPDTHEVLFMHGGAHGQFAGIPMNIAYEHKKIDFVDTGVWAQKAITEAKKVCPDIHICAKFTDRVIPPSQWDYRPDTAYIHICLNETISGIEFLEDFDLNALPKHAAPGAPRAPVVVADATSTLFSRPVNISAYGCIYCSAGKNIGPAGVCVVIIRKDLLTRTPHPCLPGILDLKAAVTSLPIPSLYNTLPCFQVYCVHKILRNVKTTGGGLEGMRTKAIARSTAVYNTIDASGGFYVNSITPDSRSRMNVCFRISTVAYRAKLRAALAAGTLAELPLPVEADFDVALEAKFVTESEANEMFQLFKHPAFGGLRITLYNAITDAAVECVVRYLSQFAGANSV